MKIRNRPRRRGPCRSIRAAASSLAAVEALEPRLLMSAAFGDRVDLPVGKGPNGIVSADFNNDGLADLAVANFNGTTISVLYGQQGGGFSGASDFTVGSRPCGIASADFNGDGLMDLAVTTWDSASVTVLYGQQGGGFGERTDLAVTNAPWGIISEDFDLDGRIDLAIASFDDNKVTILYGQQGGGFGGRTDYAVGDWAAGLVSADFNNDGLPDLAVATGWSNNISVLYGQQGGGFGELTFIEAGEQGWGIATADFNDDGLADLAVANSYDNDISIFYGQQGGGFAGRIDYAVGMAPWGIVIDDFDGDGRLDIAATNYGDGDLSVLYGQEGGGFGGRSDYAAGRGTWSLVAADFNGDGLADLAMTNWNDNDVTVLYSAGSEVAVTGNGANIADGDTTATLSDFTDFGAVIQGQAGMQRTFTVRNDGGSALILGSISLPDGFTLIESLSGSIASGESDTFTVQLDSSAAGVKSGQISFTTNDSDESPFNFTISGEVLAGPDAGDDAATTFEDAAATTIDVLANDTNNSGSLTIVSVTSASNGAVNITGDAITYQPDSDFSGEDMFTYTVRNENGLTATATVTVTITPINDRPTTDGQTLAINADESVEVTLTAFDLETSLGDMVFNITGPSYGTLTLLSPGQYRYTPDANYYGPDSFSYTVTDSGDPAGSESNPSPLTSESATVTFQVGRKLDLDGRGKAKFQDANGEWVTVWLRGPGTGTVYFAQAGLRDASMIVLAGTTLRSSLKIYTKGAGSQTSVADIIVNGGSIKSIIGKTTDLTGDITVDGKLRKLILDDVIGESIIDIGGALTAEDITAGDKVKMKFDWVTDATVNTHLLPISSLTATGWLDSDGKENDSVTAAWMSRLNIRGTRGAGNGDFDAKLTLTSSDRKGYSLRKARIAGQASATWNMQGNVGKIKAFATSANWKLEAGGFVKKLYVRGDLNGTMSAEWISKITTRGDFSADVTISGVDARGYSLRKLSISGAAVDSTVRTAGSIGKITMTSASGSDFLAGIAGDVERYAASEADFTNLAVIKYIKIKGVKGSSQRFFLDSNFSAAAFGKVRIANAEAAGIYALDVDGDKEIRRIVGTEGQTRETWTWSSRTGTSFSGPGVTVSIL